MKAVADALGVDRKALHRHVGDLDGLIDLVVADRFEAELRAVEVPDNSPWQALLSIYAHALRSGVAGLAGIRAPLQLRGGTDSLMLPWAERVLDAMVDNGFSIAEAGSTLTLVADVAIAAGRTADAIGHPHIPAVARALSDGQDFPRLTEVISTRSTGRWADHDFDFHLAIIVAGLEAQLHATNTAEGPR